MEVFVFQRLDGSIWADYTQPKNTHLLDRVSVGTEYDHKMITIRNSKYVPERVLALSERAITETAAKIPLEEIGPVPRRIKNRGFFGRLKWMFLGK